MRLRKYGPDYVVQQLLRTDLWRGDSLLSLQVPCNLIIA